MSVVDWGDAPTWVTALLAGVAAYFAGQAWVIQRNQMTAQQEQWREQRTAELERERRAQAALVAAWGAPDDRDKILVSNRSDLPVAWVVVTVHGLGAVSHYYQQSLPPGVNPVVIQPTEGPVMAVRVAFTDAAGQEWHRDGEGRLAEGYPVSYAQALAHRTLRNSQGLVQLYLHHGDQEWVRWRPDEEEQAAAEEQARETFLADLSPKEFAEEMQERAAEQEARDEARRRWDS